MKFSKILSSIPDNVASGFVTEWAGKEVLTLSKTSFNLEQKATFASLEGADVVADEQHFARFINAALLADWACYSLASDRADYARLNAVMKIFPQGFRVWFCKFEDRYMPVGYTGWYPISVEAFNMAHDYPGKIANRSELRPQGQSSSARGDYIWLFNYSIIEPLRKSAQSKMMLESYATDISKLNCLGMAAAVLSPESERVATRLGLTYRGNMTHEGVKEKLFAVKLHPTQTAERS